MDCGERGLERTLQACGEAGLAAAGAGCDLDAARRPAVLERSGRRVVVLAYGATSGDGAGPGRPGIAPLEPELVLEDVAHWRPRADVLVVSAHWGSMYVDYPPPRVIALARRLIEAGVDVVAGHHPHVTQGFLREGRTLVLFSLGDTAFNAHAGDFHASVGATKRLDAGVFTARLAPGVAPGLDLEPMVLDDDGMPGPADAARAARLRDRLLALSRDVDAAAARFHEDSAPQLLRYELERLGHYVRHGRFDRIARMLSTFKPRHVSLLWHAVRRRAGGA
jgi:poly-gamma-glutamate synthesis protein (capsule biosynthesis protein)